MTSIQKVPQRAPRRGLEARPFLKWAGGKSQLLADILDRFPSSFGTYHEPFVGSGALFFRLACEGRLKKVSLSDINRNLIDTWTALRDDVEVVISYLLDHINDPDWFYRVRSQDPAQLVPAERAARMIYLNKTCFNGLYRENRAGHFNVPFGRYSNPNICDADNLRAVSRLLKPVDITCRPYDLVLERAKAGDLVYFDPPYHPISATSSFTGYDRHGFGIEDQKRLRDTFTELSNRGVHVLLSNSDTPAIRELYSNFKIDQVFATRAINSKADKRGKVAEVIVRSF